MVSLDFELCVRWVKVFVGLILLIKVIIYCVVHKSYHN